MSNNTTGGPDFVKKLFKMLEDESYNDIVAWGVNGDSFVVKEIDAFTKTILPRHFKHSNFASFVRQLNKYDFHKIRNSDDVNAPYGEQAWEFRHPKFQCNKRDQLDNIKRKTPAGRKTATNTPQNNEAPANSHLSDLQSQVNTLNKLQDNMNNHLHTLSKNYQTVVQDIMNFQKNLIAQDQLMQNLVQYLVNQEAEKAGASNFLHRSSTGFGADNSVSFIPSEQAQKLIDSYTEVARASFEQMNEISRRAQQSFSQLVHNDKPSSSQSSTTPNPPITPPPDQTLDLGSQPINANNAGKASSLQKLQSNRNSIPSQQTSTNALSSTAMSSNHTLNSSSTLKAPDTYSQNATGLGLNPQLTDNNGLTVFTVGHLAPKQTQMTSNNTSMTQPSNSSSQIPNTLTQRGSNTMRVHRTTFIPAWSIPPKVLLVEDDEVYQNIGTKLLQVFGCTIDIAMDGVTAVNKMNLAKYDLVLMDIVLPNLDGVEATTQIRRFDPNTPIISMTSNTTKLDCIKYINHGMNDVLAKPFTKNKLLAMLERYCMHLKVLPNFQEIPRPLGTPDGSLVPSNQLTTTAINNLSNPPNNVREWIPSQLIQNDFTYASSTNQLDTIGGDYMSMVHIMGMSTSGQSTGTVRFADDLYGNTDPRSCRENKRAKFEVLDD